MYVFFSWGIKRVELFPLWLSEAPFLTLTRAFTSMTFEFIGGHQQTAIRVCVSCFVMPGLRRYVAVYLSLVVPQVRIERKRREGVGCHDL